MVYVGIDVAKDKHACCILPDDGDRRAKTLEIPNSIKGFHRLAQMIAGCAPDKAQVRIALESTGHYAGNLLAWLLDEGYRTYLLNPLLTAQYHRSRTIRRTKTDRIDSRAIAELLKTSENLLPYSRQSAILQDLKGLTRYRYEQVRERAKQKTDVARLVNLLFPELERFFSDLHTNSVHALLTNYPGAAQIAAADPEDITALLSTASHGHIHREKALAIIEAARSSIGERSPSRSLELRQTLLQIGSKDRNIREIEAMIVTLMKDIPTQITTVPGIGLQTAAVIVSEIGDFRRFADADKLLAYAGLCPTVYQSGKIDSPYAHMDKMGSRYLRYALFLAAKYVSRWDPNFRAYLGRKMTEGKHYNIAISHVAKKLVQLLYSMEIHDRPYDPARYAADRGVKGDGSL